MSKLADGADPDATAGTDVEHGHAAMVQIEPGPGLRGQLQSPADEVPEYKGLEMFSCPQFQSLPRGE